MTKTTTLVLGAAFWALASTSVAAQSADAQAERRVRNMDSNGDRMVSLEEFTAFRKGWVEKQGRDQKLLEPKVIERAFRRLDTDGDGQISAAEFTARRDESQGD